MVLEGGGEDVLGRGKGTFPLEPRAVPLECRSQGRALALSKTKHFPNKNSLRKLDFLKMQFVASF